MTGSDIVTAARRHLGTPFAHQGRIPGLALDCAGLVIVVAAELEISHSDVSGYSRTPSQGVLQSTLDAQPSLCRVPLSSLQAGDVLLMRFGGEPQHLAICGGETMIHSYLQVGRVVEHGLDAAWRRRIVGVYRFAEVSDE